MNRRTRTLRLALALLLLVGIGVTYAAVDDSTTTANNRIESANVPNQVDLRISAHDAPLASNSQCDADLANGDYVQNQSPTSNLLVLNNASPGDSKDDFVCVRNFGSDAANLDLATLIDVTDIDTGCTGNESSTDTTCGGDAAGELSSEVRIDVGVNNNLLEFLRNCDPNPANRFSFGSGATPAISEGASTAASSAIELDPGQAACLTLHVEYRQTGTTASEENENQTDQVSFKLRFRGTQA